MAIAKQRALERFKRATVLQRQARGHSSVTRVGVALRAGFVVLQEISPTVPSAYRPRVAV